MTVTTAFVAFVLLIGPGVATAASSSSSQTYQLGLGGGLVNVGRQAYTSSGNQLVSASITLPGGITLPVSAKAQFSYFLAVAVQGLKVTGFATLHYTDTSAQTGPISIFATALVGDMIPAFCLPSFNSPCDTTDTSAVAAFYVGTATMTVTIGNSKPTTMTNVPVLFESAYMNPFGNTLFVGTADGSLSFGVKYQMALSTWSSLTTAGSAVGASGLKGNFAQTASILENLVSGNESDFGQITLSGFSGRYSALNAAGSFTGKSDIPMTGSYDCTDMLQAALTYFGLPITLPANSCLATGSHSTGQFDLRGTASGQSSHVTGSYDLNWSVPAVGFQGTVTATVGNR
jgi:hypothetical protein